MTSSGGLTLPQAKLLSHWVIDGRQHEHPKTKCCGCGNAWSVSAGEAGKPGPQPGAFCICSFCASICRYRSDLSGVVLSKKELRSLPRSFRRLVLELQATLRASIRAKKWRSS